MTKIAKQNKGRYAVEARVIRQEGRCGFGHEVGDIILFDGKTIQGKICMHALNSFLPKVYALRYGAHFPWLEDPDVSISACPDAKNPCVFEIRRIRED